MESNIAVRCSNISKKYNIYHNEREQLKSLLFKRYKPDTFSALDDINLTFYHGEIVGIMGLNGSGKSTLANIIAGITYPTTGQVEVNGDVSMLAVNVGLDNYMTGRENIWYKCILLGFNKKFISQIEHDVVDFADIGIFIDQPVRTYSSGMRSRLGFAISVHLDPGILIIDEALAVGDNSFSERSLAKMYEFKARKKTILYISHSVSEIRRFCDKSLWLHMGKIIGFGLPDEIIAPYCEFAQDYGNMKKEERDVFMPSLLEYQTKVK